MKPARLGFIATLSAAIITLTTTPAYADSAVYSYDLGAKASFQSYGEIFKLCDIKADGHSAVVKVSLYHGTYLGTAWNHNGANTCVDINEDYPEGTTVTYFACTGEYGTRTIIESSCKGTTDVA